MSESENPKIFDFKVFQPRFESLCKKLIHKVERESSPDLNSSSMTRGFFMVSLKSAHNTFQTICYLCADVRLKQSDWKWQYVLVLPPLNRTILDSVFNVTFMLEDLANRSQWYHESGWREAKRELSEHRKEYGSDPLWTKWMDDLEGLLNAGIPLLNVPAAKVANPESIDWWPNPGQMPRYGVNDPLPPSRQFLKYLNDWFYREMSSQSHLSFHGVMKTGSLVIADFYDADTRESIREKHFPLFRSRQMIRTVTLLLALMSEIEMHFNFGLAPELVALWNDVTNVQEEAKEIYDRRYKDFWPRFLLQSK